MAYSFLVYQQLFGRGQDATDHPPGVGLLDTQLRTLQLVNMAVSGCEC